MSLQSRLTRLEAQAPGQVCAKCGHGPGPQSFKIDETWPDHPRMVPTQKCSACDAVLSFSLQIGAEDLHEALPPLVDCGAVQITRDGQPVDILEAQLDGALEQVIKHMSAAIPSVEGAERMKLDKRISALEKAQPAELGPVCSCCHGQWVNVKNLGKSEPDYPCPQCGSAPKTIMECAEPSQLEHMRETMALMCELGPVGMRDEWQRRHPEAVQPNAPVTVTARQDPSAVAPTVSRVEPPITQAAPVLTRQVAPDVPKPYTPHPQDLIDDRREQWSGKQF